MLRTVSILALVSGFFALSAYRAAEPKFGDQLFPVNTTVAQFFLSEERQLAPSSDEEWMPETDTLLSMHILMLNYSAYDNVYPEKTKVLIQRSFPMSVMTDFWEGSAADLSGSLAGQDIVVVPYPAGGNPDNLKRYGKELAKFVRQGGLVIFTGTDQYAVLQDFGLLDIDFGYFCKAPTIHETSPEHPVLTGTTEEFSMRNYAYPLDISDPNFVVLADVKGYPVLGYKPIGKGNVVYLGFEYYFDEKESTQVLLNAIRWAAQGKPVIAEKGIETESSVVTPLVLKRSEEILYAGTGGQKNEMFDLKIYPNPYVSKATLDIELKKSTTLSVEMVDESGRIAALLLPKKSLSPGFYRLELPNVAPGVYLVQCKTNEGTTIRRVFKTAAN
ncbi:MAG: T9SS type A sorting domain-containing protein [Saprospiraceae bacterium]|nr:T9SS type A sorting domain-containing protein [Saprospiraceae bacterium]